MSDPGRSESPADARRACPVVMLCVTIPTMGLQASSNTAGPAHPEVWPLERGKWEAIIATDEETVRGAAKENYRRLFGLGVLLGR